MGSVAVPGEYAYRNIEGEDQSHEHQRPGPGLAVPVVVRGDGVEVDLQRERRDRLLEVVVPEIIPEDGKDQGGRLPGDARQGDDDPGGDALQGSPHDDDDDDLPAGHTEGQGG